MSSRSSRTLGLALATLSLAVLLPVGAEAREVAEPTVEPTARAGAPGIGDAYWPLDGNGGIDVLHYDVHDTYDFATERLSGTTVLRVRATTALTRFNLDFLLSTSSVLVDGAPATTSRPSPHELSITPATPLAAGATFEVEVTYADRPGRHRYAGENNWLADDDEVVTMNEPHMAPWWFPANDHPRDKATYDVTVTGPADLEVVSNGLLVDRTTDTTTGRPLATTHWRTTSPMASYLAFFALGDYTVAHGVRDGLPWYVAVSKDLDPDRQRLARRSLVKTPAITAWLGRRLGRYPFESTGGLTTALPVRFALENQTRPTYAASFGGDTSVVVHELAHQWFGDSVSVHRWRDIWLNEGFATFMEAAYTERHGGRSADQWLRRTLQDLRDYAPRSFWRVDVADPGAHHLFDGAVYARGGLTLQALRNRIGERDFWTTLRTWLRDHRYGTATVPQFDALAERVSGERLDGFFQAWLRAPRPPAETRANGLR